MTQEYSKKIGVLTATIVGMNAMIGAGVFTLPTIIGCYLGPASIITTFLVSIAVLFMALSFARLAALFPQAGSFYTYAKQWGGHTIGLLSSGAYIVGLLIAMGLLSRAAGVYLHESFPMLSIYQWGIITLATLTLLNMSGVALSQLGQYILICCTTLPLIVITIMCFSKAHLYNLVPFAPYGYKNIFLAMREVIFGFFGFEAAASLVPRLFDPKKNVPKAVTYSVLIVATIYLLFVAALILSVPHTLFCTPDIPITKPLSTIFPTMGWVITITHFSILSAILGTIHSMIWSSGSLILSLVRLLKSSTSKRLIKSGIINNKTTTFFVGLTILASFLTFENAQFFFFTAFFLVFAYSTSMITLLTIKKERESKTVIITLIGLGTATLIFIFALEGVIRTFIN